MSEYREVLCVGGRHDGRRVKVDKHDPTFRLVDYEDEMPLCQLMAPIHPFDQAGEIKASLYVVVEFHSKSRNFYLARPPDQSEDATFALLMQGYRGV